MEKLITTFLSARLYAHFAHHKTRGATFHQDHEAFGELYKTYDAAFDELVERAIGLGQNFDYHNLLKPATVACIACCVHDDRPEQFYQRLLFTEKEIQEQAEEAAKKATFGTQNFLQGLADDSEKRVYKIQQRLA